MASPGDAYAGLARAAAGLGVTGLGSGSIDSAESDQSTVQRLCLAAAVSGAAEAVAMVRASVLASREPTPLHADGAERGVVELPALVDRVAFRAAGIRGSDASTSSQNNRSAGPRRWDTSRQPWG
jgi:hypothetical protein